MLERWTRGCGCIILGSPEGHDVLVMALHAGTPAFCKWLAELLLRALDRQSAHRTNLLVALRAVSSADW